MRKRSTRRIVLLWHVRTAEAIITDCIISWMDSGFRWDSQYGIYEPFVEAAVAYSGSTGSSCLLQGSSQGYMRTPILSSLLQSNRATPKTLKASSVFVISYSGNVYIISLAAQRTPGDTRPLPARELRSVPHTTISQLPAPYTNCAARQPSMALSYQ